jgi:uncharacterized membrane protein YfcA
MPYISYIIIGLLAGILAGLFGVGGGLIIVPALVLVLGFSQFAANGTSLVALLLPVGIGGVIAYYRAGKIDVGNIYGGLVISVGMFLGAFLGSKLALTLPEVLLKRSFCVFILFVAVKLWMSTY